MFSIDRLSNIPLSNQIEENLRRLVESRVLPGGAKLMSIRQLATHLAVSTNTVVVAYDRLVAGGVINSHGTAGFLSVQPAMQTELVPTKLHWKQANNKNRYG